MESLHGKGRQPCSYPKCSFRSLAGLKRGFGLCPYHWTEVQWGKDHAQKCYPNWTPNREEGK